MSDLRQFGPARLFGVAGFLAVIGPAALAQSADEDPRDTAEAVAISATEIGPDDGVEPIDIVLEVDGADPYGTEYEVGSIDDFVADDGCVEDCIYPTMLPTLSEAAPAAAAILPRDRDDRRVIAARAQRNICTEADLYVAWLCSWQGYQRP